MLKMEKIVSLCKQRGFIFASSEIYGGLANSWDYGPLGVELKNNIKNLWWKNFVHQKDNIVGLDSAILMNANVWKASGHLANFVDPLVDCKICHRRFRADHLLAQHFKKQGLKVNVSQWNLAELTKQLAINKIICLHCGNKDWTDVRQFNLMFETQQGVTKDSLDTIYLRPETAQGIFVQFKNIAQVSRKKLPFGIAQIGKAFRNEITPGNFIFRTREFEQMEIEYFCYKQEAQDKFQQWKKLCEQWLLAIGIKQINFRWVDHSSSELSHYSQATSDLEFQFPFGWSELWGLAHRGNYDLVQHQTHSKKDLSYLDTEKNEKILPDCIEPSLGVDRLFLAIICDAYQEQKLVNETRNLLKIDHRLAPYKAAILPLSKKLSEQSYKIYQTLNQHFLCDFDDTGSIGKRYRRQDEIGTPFCITFDFDSVSDEQVTLRYRDDMKQTRIKITQLAQHLKTKLEAS